MQYVTDENNRVLHIIKSEEEYNAERSFRASINCLGQFILLGLFVLGISGLTLYILGSILVEALR